MSERELMRRVNRGVVAGMILTWGIILPALDFKAVVHFSGIKVAFAIVTCVIGLLIYVCATNGYTGDE